jgi:hypothetical protein
MPEEPHLKAEAIPDDTNEAKQVSGRRKKAAKAKQAKPGSFGAASAQALVPACLERSVAF